MKYSIKDLDITLEELYEGERQVHVHVIDQNKVFHVVLKDRHGIDCKLTCFAANQWFRTDRGMEMRKYPSFGAMQREINKLLKEKIGTKGLIQYSLSDVVYDF